MKKVQIFCGILSLLAFLGIMSCANETDDSGGKSYYTVTFVNDKGTNFTQSVESGKTATEPKEPNITGGGIFLRVGIKTAIIPSNLIFPQQLRKILPSMQNGKLRRKSKLREKPSV